jgi:single-strand DNA-binding protein
MVNESFFSVRGYVATQPRSGYLKDGTTRTFSTRVGWTPRLLNRSTGEWTDQPTSFVSLQCYGKIAEHAALCVHRGDPVVLTGRLRIREYTDQAGAKRNSVEVTADSFGHDMSRGISIHTKAPQHQDQTAAEAEQSMAAGRSPLPGDLAAQQGAEDDESARDADELAPGYQPDVHLDGAGDFDDEESAEGAGHEGLPEPAGATA